MTGTQQLMEFHGVIQVDFCLCPMSQHGISLSPKHLIRDSFAGVLQIWAVFYRNFISIEPEKEKNGVELHHR